MNGKFNIEFEGPTAAAQDQTAIFTFHGNKDYEDQEEAEAALSWLACWFPTDGHWNLELTYSEQTGVPILKAAPLTPELAARYGLADGDWTK